MTHLSEEVVRSKEVEDNLREKVAKARSLLVNMTLSKKKLDAMVNDMKIPNDKRGLGFQNDKKISSTSKIMFLNGNGIKEASPPQHPRRKIELGESSKSGKMKMPTKSEA